MRSNSTRNQLVNTLRREASKGSTELRRLVATMDQSIAECCSDRELDSFLDYGLRLTAKGRRSAAVSRPRPSPPTWALRAEVMGEVHEADGAAAPPLAAREERERRAEERAAEVELAERHAATLERAAKEAVALKAGAPTARMRAVAARLRSLYSVAKTEWLPPATNAAWSPELDDFERELKRAVRRAIVSVVEPRLQAAKRELEEATAEREELIQRLQAAT